MCFCAPPRLYHATSATCCCSKTRSGGKHTDPFKLGRRDLKGLYEDIRKVRWFRWCPEVMLGFWNYEHTVWVSDMYSAMIHECRVSEVSWATTMGQCGRLNTCYLAESGSCRVGKLEKWYRQPLPPCPASYLTFPLQAHHLLQDFWNTEAFPWFLLLPYLSQNISARLPQIGFLHETLFPKKVSLAPNLTWIFKCPSSASFPTFLLEPHATLPFS